MPPEPPAASSPAAAVAARPGVAVAAVVLAAGSSTRMGNNKLLLPLGEESVLRRTVRAAVDAGLSPVVVVLGHDAERTREQIAGLPCRAVTNPDYRHGKGSSLQTGISEVSSATTAAAAMVMLADMPFVTAAMLAEIAGLHRRSGAAMVISRYGEVNAPPMLYARELFGELLALPGEACGKEMVRRHRHEAAIASWPEEALADIDMPDDYRRIRARLAELATKPEAAKPLNAQPVMAPNAQAAEPPSAQAAEPLMGRPPTERG